MKKEHRLAAWKPLIISQVFAVMAVISAVLAYLRYVQINGVWDTHTVSLTLCTLVFFFLEILFMRDWLKSRTKP